ncbi:MAG: MFS transporter [Desulfurococcaceae archaeon]
MLKLINVAISFIVMLFINIGVIGSLLILYIRDIYRLETITPIAVSFTIGGMLSAISMPIAGHVYDKKGPRVMLSFTASCTLLWGLCMYLMGKTGSWSHAMIAWYFAWAFQGFAFPFVVMSINPVLMMTFPDRRGLVISITQSAQALSMAFWPYMLRHMAQVLGFFNALATIGVLNALILMFASALHNRLNGYAKPSGHEKASALPGNQRRVTGLITVFLMIFFIAMSSMIIMSFFAGILEDLFQGPGKHITDVNGTLIPLIMSLTGLLQALMAMPWGILIDKIGPFKTIPATYMAETLSTFLAFITYTSNPWITSVFIVMRYVFFTGEPVAHWTLIPLIFGIENFGLISGTLNSAPIASSIIAPLLGGLIKDITGSYRALLILSTGLSLLAFSVYGIKLRELMSTRSATE